jgi:hypothetical protein
MGKLLAAPAFVGDVDLVRFRNEIAMHALNSMVIAGGWGYTDGESKRHNYQFMVDYFDAAYRSADEPLKARERR